MLWEIKTNDVGQRQHISTQANEDSHHDDAACLRLMMKSNQVDQGLNNHVQQSVPNQDEDGYHVVVESTVRMENGVVQANLLWISKRALVLEVSLQLLWHLIPSILKILCKCWSDTFLLVLIVTEAR